MESLEAEARKEYDELCVGLGTYADVHAAHKERVAIGFQDPEDGSVVWYALTNEVDGWDDAANDGRGEFYVSGEQLARVIVDAVQDGMESWARILWHTHVNTTGPSADDVAEFPGELFELGMIYHVPSDTTTLYNRSGIITPSNSLELAPIATTED